MPRLKWAAKGAVAKHGTRATLAASGEPFSGRAPLVPFEGGNLLPQAADPA